MSQVVNYLSFQKSKRSIRFHQRSLIKATNLRSATQLNVERLLDTLLRIPENPKLTMEQQRELKTKIAGFLFTNYENLYSKHGKKIAEWVYANGTPAIRDKALAAAKNFNKLTDYYIYALINLNRVLLDLSSKEDIGFSSETLAYFDVISLKEKVRLVSSSEALPKFNSPKAQSLFESWGRSFVVR